MAREEAILLAREFGAQRNCVLDGEIAFTGKSFVWPATNRNERLMLKITDRNDEEAEGAEMLRLYEGRGAVKLFERERNVQLMERAGSNGQPELERMVLEGHDDKATGIICEVVAELHEAVKGKMPPATLIPFRERSYEMRKHLEEGRVRPEDRALFGKAGEICEELISETADSQMPLHGDIHHFNILPSQRGWLAIDPKGIWGPRIYEYANTLCNPYNHVGIVADAKRMDRQASIIAERAGVERPLLLRFTFLHGAQAAAWSIEEPEYWLACARTAAELAGLEIA
jgi:streptomycin 6-kinase